MARRRAQNGTASLRSGESQTAQPSDSSSLVGARNLAINDGQFNNVQGHHTNLVINLNQNSPTQTRSPFSDRIASSDPSMSSHRNAGLPLSGSSLYENNRSQTNTLGEGRTVVPENFASGQLPVQQSNVIYQRHLELKGRGFPLWIPPANQNLPVQYRRTGVRIGDVGIITPDGGFSFLFNICLPRDDPVNPRVLPDQFSPIFPPIEATNIDKFSVFGHGSHLASASIEKAEANSQFSGFQFESSASEGAILTMPLGATSESLGDIAKFRRYAASNIVHWYKFVNCTLGREAKNGDIRLVVGCDKTTTWGIATFANQSCQSSCRLRFGPPAVSSSDSVSSNSSRYVWEYSGIADVRAGPSPGENNGLSQVDDPGHGDVIYENQCLFLRTLNTTLRDDIWSDIHCDSSSVDLQLQSDFHLAKDSASTASSINRTSATEDKSSTPSSYSSGKNNTAAFDDQLAIFDSGPPSAVISHPSKALNDILMAKVPAAHMVITRDEDWSSIASEYGRFPDPHELLQQILVSHCICEEDGVIFLDRREAIRGGDSNAHELVSENLGAKAQSALLQNHEISISPPYTVAPSSAVEEIRNIVEDAKNDQIVNSHSTEFDIEKEYVGRIVGAQGAGIYKLRGRLDVKVEVSDDVHESEKEDNEKTKTAHEKPRVKITGRKEDVEEAKRRILTQVERLADETSEILKISPQYHSSLIGKNGKYVIYLEVKHSVKITFPRQIGEAKTVEQLNSDEVMVKGGKKGVAGAKSELLDALEFEKEFNNVLKFTVTARSVARFLGRGGSSINGIKDNTDAQIVVDKYTKDGATTLITALGTEQAIAAAKPAILQILNQVTDETSTSVAIEGKFHRNIIGAGRQGPKELISRSGGPQSFRSPASRTDSAELWNEIEAMINLGLTQGMRLTGAGMDMGASVLGLPPVGMKGSVRTAGKAGERLTLDQNQVQASRLPTTDSDLDVGTSRTGLVISTIGNLVGSSAALTERFSPILPFSNEEEKVTTVLRASENVLGTTDHLKQRSRELPARDQANRDSSRSGSGTSTAVSVAVAAIARKISKARRAVVLKGTNVDPVLLAPATYYSNGGMSSTIPPSAVPIDSRYTPSLLSSNFENSSEESAGSLSPSLSPSSPLQDNYPTPGTDSASLASPLLYYLDEAQTSSPLPEKMTSEAFPPLLSTTPRPHRTKAPNEGDANIYDYNYSPGDDEDEDGVPFAYPDVELEVVQASMAAATCSVPAPRPTNAISDEPLSASIPITITVSTVPLSPFQQYRGWLFAIVAPLEEFIDESVDPRKHYLDLKEIAEGESGSVFSARLNPLTASMLRLPPIIKAKDEEEMSQHPEQVKLVAIKSVAIVPSGSKLVNLRKELMLMKWLVGHENILGMDGVYVDFVEDSLWMRMELMERSLADMVGLVGDELMLQDRTLARFASDVLSALEYLQKHSIAHRDVRSDNLLLNKHGFLKLADFSNAVQVTKDSPMRTDPAGVVYWQAPEVRQPPYNALKVDVWSLGATVWEMVQTEPPFYDNQQFGNRWPPLRQPELYSPAFHGFLRKCSEPALSRPNPSDLLKYPFVHNACGRSVIVHLLSQCMAIEQSP